ncbi:MAG TPA: CDP-alcohol phosphatidyltransferase family protein [Candidatus Saccharimonadales bacterium]|nr:CDP-alcohol phosphatidyltransferase family protein [Candidatus Saccharimonadales bacterium]
MQILDSIRDLVRSVMKSLAKALNSLTGGSLSPNTVTIVGLLAHLPIAYLIATRHNLRAAVLLVIFGLFDTLDGELARLQKRDSAAGMLLDATTDRFKEVMLYTGAAYAIAGSGRPLMAGWAVVACGASLCVSYVKAKGETAVAKSHLSVSEINRLFADGLMRFEVRMTILVIGLLSNRIILAIVVIAVFSSLTAINRLVNISTKLKDV